MTVARNFLFYKVVAMTSSSHTYKRLHRLITKMMHSVRLRTPTPYIVLNENKFNDIGSYA